MTFLKIELGAVLEITRLSLCKLQELRGLFATRVEGNMFEMGTGVPNKKVATRIHGS